VQFRASAHGDTARSRSRASGGQKTPHPLMRKIETATAPIDRFRGIAARLIARQDPDWEWFRVGLSLYESGAELGLTLGDAFGFALSRGATPWWESESHARRDELIRTIAAQHFPALSGRPAAAAIAEAIARYETTAWRQHRAYLAPPPRLRGLGADLFRLLKLGTAPAEGTIRRILCGSRNTRFREPDPAAG
jgi:hypothetical protein